MFGREGWDRIPAAPGRLPFRSNPSRTIRCCAEIYRMPNFLLSQEEISVPTLVVHGSDDLIAPIETCGNLTAKIVAKAKLVVRIG
jgi:pimeloyl-ACP methyl ester carboxylesterase